MAGGSYRRSRGLGGESSPKQPDSSGGGDTGTTTQPPPNAPQVLTTINATIDALTNDFWNALPTAEAPLYVNQWNTQDPRIPFGFQIPVTVKGIQGYDRPVNWSFYRSFSIPAEAGYYVISAPVGYGMDAKTVNKGGVSWIMKAFNSMVFIKVT